MIYKHGTKGDLALHQPYVFQVLFRLPPKCSHFYTLPTPPLLHPTILIRHRNQFQRVPAGVGSASMCDTWKHPEPNNVPSQINVSNLLWPRRKAFIHVNFSFNVLFLKKKKKKNAVSSKKISRSQKYIYTYFCGLTRDREACKVPEDARGTIHWWFLLRSHNMDAEVHSEQNIHFAH